MKFRSYCPLIALIGMLSPSASAAVIIAFTPDHIPEDPTKPVEAAYSAGKTFEVSSFAPSSPVISRMPGSLTYSGWTNGFDLNRYVGFTVTATEGYELQLTQLSFDTIIGTSGISARAVGAYVWGYRVSDNGEFGAWTFGDTFLSSSPGSETPKIWDFDDIHTTGSVEFGLFVSTGIPTQSLTIGLVNVSGPVPEPSALLLTACSASFFFVRRRRSQA